MEGKKSVITLISRTNIQKIINNNCAGRASEKWKEMERKLEDLKPSKKIIYGKMREKNKNESTK